LQNIKDQWIYFIKNAGSLEYIPTNLDIQIQQALESVNEANLTKEELEVQYKRREFISIQKLALLKAKNDGLQEGLEKGIEQEKIEIAKKSIANNLDDKTIALITGLSQEVIKSLRG